MTYLGKNENLGSEKMKRIFSVLSLLFLLLLIACSDDDKAWEPYSPENTSSLMMQYANQENYEGFKSLILEGYEEDSMKQMYETTMQAVSQSAGVSTLTLVSFDNGKSLLVHFTPQTEEGEVLIQDIIEIPEEMAAYIEEGLNLR